MLTRECESIVREKTKQILDLLNDNDRIRDEREKSRKLRDKYTGVGSGGGGGFSGGGFSGGGFSGGGYSGGGGGGFSGGGGYSGGQGGGGGYSGGGGGGYSGGGGSSYSGGGGYGGNSDRNDERDKGYSSRYADEQDDYRSARGGRREKSRDESESEEEEDVSPSNVCIGRSTHLSGVSLTISPSSLDKYTPSRGFSKEGEQEEGGEPSCTAGFAPRRMLTLLICGMVG
jgi:hypothetical protein